MPGVADIPHVDEFHSVTAQRNEKHVAGYVNSRGKFYGIVELQVFYSIEVRRIHYVQAVATGGDVNRPVVRHYLPGSAVDGAFRTKARRKGTGHIEDQHPAPGRAIQVVASQIQCIARLARLRDPVDFPEHIPGKVLDFGNRFRGALILPETDLRGVGMGCRT